MNIIRLATRLGLTDELKDNLIETYCKDKHTTKLEAAEYVCSKYVENEICQMKKSIEILQKAVNHLDEKTNCIR